MCHGIRVSDLKKSERWAKNQDGEAFRKVINKLLDERNLRDHHLKLYHVSTSQFKKEYELYLDLPRNISDLYHHV